MALDGPTISVRRTLFGLERRGLLATGVVAAIVAFCAIGLPLIARAVPAPGHTFEAGTVLAVPDGRARFTPASGWSRNRDGVPKSIVSVVSGSVEFRIGGFASDAGAPVLIDLLQREMREQLPSVVFLDNETIPTTSGLVGVWSWFRSPDQEGFVAVFSQVGSVVVVSCAGLAGAVDEQSGDVDGMIRSIELVR